MPFSMKVLVNYEEKEVAMTNKKSRTFLQSASLLRAFLIYFSALLVLISMGAFLLNIHAWPLFTAVFGAWMLILRSFFRSSK